MEIHMTKKVENTSVLIVDDYHILIKNMKTMLMQLGFKKIDSTDNGNNAINMLHQQPYDLVISDWNMEPLTGLELLREVRNDNKFSDTLFLMVTTESHHETITTAKAAGANGCLVKPFDAGILRSKLIDIIEERLH